jgi:hypothetical protein
LDSPGKSDPGVSLGAAALRAESSEIP